MEINDNCIKLKSVPAMYEHEYSGVKPNTIRVMNLSEYEQLKHLNFQHIHIINSLTEESF